LFTMREYTARNRMKLRVCVCVCDCKGKGGWCVGVGGCVGGWVFEWRSGRVGGCWRMSGEPHHHTGCRLGWPDPAAGRHHMATRQPRVAAAPPPQLTPPKP
jgi:hypothetical protein